MEPSANPAAGAAPAAVLGELVVGNGRLIATRKPLTAALTLVGEGSGCDVRLRNDKVAPFHCALFHGPTGFVLRNLGKRGETRVNGEAAETRPLRHGDRIEVGPYSLVLELPNGGQGEVPTDPALEAEREAVRIQAAAVVAQQAELTEEELRLSQRLVGLERQEEQLAGHLEEKRRGLIEVREQVRAERDALKEKRAEEEQQIAARHAEAEQAFAEADADRKAAKQERANAAAERKELQRRWNEQFAVHEAELRKREEVLSKTAAGLKAEADRLERDKAALTQQRLQHNGDMELGRRRLEESRRELTLAQHEWESFLDREKADFERREAELAERAAELARQESDVAEKAKAWENVKAQQEKEAEGLEARIRNQRTKLQSLEQTAASLQAAAQAPRASGAAPVLSLRPVPEPVAAASTGEAPEAPVVLQRLAGCLADQRLHLLDQWQGVLALQEQWQQQRDAILAELEESGRRLAEREKTLGEREQQWTARMAHLDQRQEMLTQLRGSLEGRQARFRVASQEWEAERERALAEMKQREQAAANRVRHLEIICRRSAGRNRAEAAALAKAREVCEEARKQYVLLWDECRSQAETLRAGKQALAGEANALEQLRFEVLGKSENAAAAEKRLDKLRRQSQELVSRAEAELARAREVLRAEAIKLEERVQAVRVDEKHVLSWRRRLAKRQKQHDEQAAAAEETQLQRTLELQRLQALHSQDVRQLQELRDEVERMARLMIEDAGHGSAPSSPIAA